VPRQRMEKLKIGDDAIVDVAHFSLEGKSKREFRAKVRQLESVGIRVRKYAPPLSDDVLTRLKAVSDEWLRMLGRRERAFTLGMFAEEYVRSTPVLAAVDNGGNILAFINLILLPNLKELSADMMRRRKQTPNGIMDYLFVKLFLYARENGYERFNMGMAPMVGFQEREEATAEERAIHAFFQQLNLMASFRGLRSFKAKFATFWEPRYLIYRSALELPRVALALRRVSEARDEEPGVETREAA
jgi:phosphatidylglycerol lysyltransferase